MSGLANSGINVYIEEIIDTPEQQESFRFEDEEIRALNNAMLKQGVIDNDSTSSNSSGEDDDDDVVEEGVEVGDKRMGVIQEVDLMSGGVVEKTVEGSSRASASADDDDDKKKNSKKKKKKKKKKNLKDPSTTSPLPLTASSRCVSTSASAPFPPRGGFTLTPLTPTHLLLLGGASRSGECYGFEDITFNVTNDKWIKGEGWKGRDILPMINGHAATGLGEGRVLVTGGVKIEDGHATLSEGTYLLENGEWKDVGDKPEGGRNGAQMVEWGGKGWLYGGAGETRTYGDVWIFEIGKGWKEARVEGATPKSREMHSCVSVEGGFVVVGGRHTETGEVLRDCWRFLISEDGMGGEWCELTKPPEKRCAGGAGTVRGGKVLVYWGGYDGGEVMYDTAMVLDLEMGVWKVLEVEGAPVIRFGHAVVGVGEDILVVGGVNPFNDLADVHKIRIE
ncbi:hypothetical protein TrCOL_g10769 [Triparma columacea]|uniref:Uncharacterized protein n=1 Tax=Triparma columacea TaxID=722753 RepID=A0A9W7LGF9_9STRA|nr:hypothetical protein TrCOL_g10769 [Triparma columacea]